MTAHNHPDTASGRKKKKTHQEIPRSRFSVTVFLVLWTLAHMLMWGPLAELSFRYQRTLSPDGLFSIIMSTLVSLPVIWVLGQGLLLRLQYNWSLRRWILATLAGGLLMLPVLSATQFLMPFLNSLGLSMNVASSAMNVLVILPLLLAQMWALKRYVRHVWLWAMGSLTGLAVGFTVYQTLAPRIRSLYSISLENLLEITLFNGAQGAGFGLVTGLVLVAMVMLTRSARTHSAETTQQHSAITTQTASQLTQSTDNNTPNIVYQSDETQQTGYTHG